METERAKRLASFVSWVEANIKGDEKGEVQVFLDRFFQAFAHAGLREAGATLEERIKKSDGKGTAFADLVWKPGCPRQSGQEAVGAVARREIEMEVDSSKQSSRRLPSGAPNSSIGSNRVLHAYESSW